MYQIKITATAKKELNKLSKKKQEKYFLVVDLLRELPYSGKKLSGELGNYYSARLWPYRIIYTVNKKRKAIVIGALKHRQEAYK